MRSECYLCGGTDPQVVAAIDKWRILRCAECGLGWLDPWPEVSQLSELYDEAYFTDHRIMVAETDEQLAKKVADQASLVRFVRRYRGSGVLLDIGCASGYFIARAREAGYEVQGLEISEWAVRQGRDRLGLQITQGTIESCDFQPSSFDAITMLHVAEHLEDPVKSIAKIREWLKPDGVLVLACPNMGSFDARKYGADWAGWRIPYHLWHFSPRSLSGILDRAGFRTICVRTEPSRWIKEKVRSIPIVSISRNIVSAFFSGRDMRLVAEWDTVT